MIAAAVLITGGCSRDAAGRVTVINATCTSSGGGLTATGNLVNPTEKSETVRVGVGHGPTRRFGAEYVLTPHGSTPYVLSSGPNASDAQCSPVSADVITAQTVITQPGAPATVRARLAPPSYNSPSFPATSTTIIAPPPVSECIAGRLTVTVSRGLPPAPRCVRLGTLVTVTFVTSGEHGYRWSVPATSDGSVLRRLAASGGVVATGSFEAVAAGSAYLSAVEAPPCFPSCLPPGFNPSLTIFVE